MISFMVTRLNPSDHIPIQNPPSTPLKSRIQSQSIMSAVTAAIMSVLLCILLRRPSKYEKGIVGEQKKRAAEMERRLSWRPADPPSTWREAVATVAETICFTYSETLRKWPIGDLAFGIKIHMRRQGLQVANVFTGSNCIKLEESELLDDLIFFSRLLDLCILFSKKPFSVFLKCCDCCPEDILFRKHKAELLKPAFLLLCDKSSKCILLIVRGMHSIKDTLTAATGLAVTFHHSFLDEYGATKVVLGYAHHGMVCAAHWIVKCATPYLLKAIRQYPSYKVKIVGNSLGAGIAAILTYILRERIEFSSATCIAFAPAACLTWDLAESGQNFITTIINCSDMVPTFSVVSADNLRLQVAASPWLNDLHDQFKQPFTSCAETLSSKCQQAVLGFARCMDCLGILSCHDEGSSPSEENTNSTEIGQYHSEIVMEQLNHSSSCSNQHLNGIEEETSTKTCASAEEEMIETELWVELRKELQRQETAADDEGDKENSTSEIIWSKQPITADEIHFFAPGRIRHIVAEESDDIASNSGESGAARPRVSIYETPRHLYGEIRLSPNMIKDHYMPAYKRMIDLMIENIRRKEIS